MKKYLIFKTEEEKKYLLDSIIGYFEIERNNKIGYIAAEEILDFFVDQIGKKIHNQTILEVQKLLNVKIQDIDIELESLKEN